MGEENPQEPAQPKPAGERRTGKKATKPVAKQTVGAPPQDIKSTYPRLIANQQMRPGEDSPLSKISDKSGNSAATSHKKYREVEGGRRIRRHDPKKGWQHRKGTTSNVNLRSRSRVTKDTFDPKGDHIPKEYTGEANC